MTQQARAAHHTEELWDNLHWSEKQMQDALAVKMDGADPENDEVISDSMRMA